MARDKDTNLSDIEDEDDLDEEPGEVIESAPPLSVGEERDIISSPGLKKKLLKRGHGWGTPKFGDEVTVHYVGTQLDGTKFISTRDKGDPVIFKLGDGQVMPALDHGIITMKEGEVALFTLPSSNSNIQYEVELLSWITVVDICNDGGIIKKIMSNGVKNVQPGDLDQVTVKYRIMLDDGTLVAETPEQGLEFYIKDGHLFPALPKALKTMKVGEKVKLTVQPKYGFGEHGLNADSMVTATPSNSVLNIDLELVSFKPVVDVTGDSKILKKILKEGEGSHTAGEGAAVTLRYTARLEDGTVVEKKGFDGDELLKFIVDAEQVNAGLDRAAATMKKGELSIVTVKPDYESGGTEVERDLATVPTSSVVIYEVEMVDFVKEKSPREMNNHEKIVAAEKKKEEGNILYKRGKYQQAAKRYDKAADYVEDGGFGDDEQKIAKALRVSCWLNHAACSLKLNNFHEAIRLCSQVLDIESHNVKALYRRAQAFIETADLEVSEFDIKKALEIEPHNREVLSLYKTLKQGQSERNKRDGKLYVNMFAPRDAKRQKVEKSEAGKSEGVASQIEMEDAAAAAGGQPSEKIAYN